MNTKSFNDLGLNEESQKIFWILLSEFSFEIKKIRPWKVGRLPCVCGDCLDPPLLKIWSLCFIALVCKEIDIFNYILCLLSRSSMVLNLGLELGLGLVRTFCPDIIELESHFILSCFVPISK